MALDVTNRALKFNSGESMEEKILNFGFKAHVPSCFE